MRSNPRLVPTTLAFLLSMALLATLGACGAKTGSKDGARAAPELGLKAGLDATVILDKLTNPSGLTFDPDGDLTVCDSGNGRVIRMTDGKPTDYVTDFDTEYWKVDKKTGTKRFRLGPLSAVYLPDGRLVVSDGGKQDGQETLLFFGSGGKAAEGDATNAVPPTTKDPKDKGEGNLTGMSRSADGSTIWVCAQGSDARTWVLRCDVATKHLEPWASADDNGISVNSPMQTLSWDAGTLLVLYSGAGGKDDGLIVAWDTATAKPKARWTLPGLTDPMGLARIPGSDALAVVDNNWALTEVKAGRLARVTLPDGGGAAKVEVLGDKLQGPVACAFDAEGTLFVAQLGKAFDKTEGNVVAIRGVR